ncbi:MAG: hypothetical protein ACLFR1_11530 [Spirochaetia bacterium]
MNNTTNTNVGFSGLVAENTYQLVKDEREHFFRKYEIIREFQQKSLELFNASLKCEFDPEVAELVLNELPEHMGRHFHLEHMADRVSLPVFFRTDEVVPGKISEIQSPGSAWGLYEQLYQLVSHFQNDFHSSSLFEKSLAKGFTEALTEYLGEQPVVHHLIDNASIPAGIRFFIQKTREQGIRYFGYDKNITPYDCNFLRSHAFAGLFSDNFFQMRLSQSKDNNLQYDLPPSILFDEKLSLIFPFWEKTRSYFSDRVRDLFPYTQLIRPEGIVIENGDKLTLEEFLQLPRGSRDYYIKYAGCDLAINWGSKGVYNAATLSKTKGKEIFDAISKDFASQRYWVLQKGYSLTEEAEFITRDDQKQSMQVHSKFSGFYGPSGLLGILVMQRPFYKVHGSIDTIMSIV